jgi:cell division protein FtsI/penicillin-binding protein 2
MTYVLENSLNTGTTFVEQKLGKQSFFDYVKKFGFGQGLGIDLPGEAEGKVYEPNELNDHGYATMSFGQSISTTPLQMITAFAAVANGGKEMRPYIVEKVSHRNGKDDSTKPKELGQIISPKAAEDLTKMMISVVEHGHGGQAKVKGYKIAGKTGTAQVVKKDGTGYEEGKNIGSFIGFDEADSKYVVLAKIDDPKGVPWAESTAAPIVGQMLDYILKYYQVTPTESMQ